MQQTILVIEDDPDIAQILTTEIEDAGYRVLTAPNRMSGLTCARSEAPDLVILDLGLPDMHGTEVARRLRRTSRTPIVVLTGMDTVASKVGLLEAGASDYLTKPFHPEELVARVRVQLRKHQQAGEVSVGALKLYLQQQVCLYQGREVRLSPKEFELLGLLAEVPGRVYSRDVIVAELWPGVVDVGRSVVEVHMANLRSKLREVGGAGVLRTVRGVGYALRDAGDAQN
ncbi:response regulator transcription factor [Deinococcus deserti]|uniref:Putative response regulator, OmpR n=1 Tax=Deinococcus deserti (strain DSM 17065 / CIP 109153 / LMG 22923 / VCD115) TaxID=546414 RepID=C1D3W4_DEIDV|nr:response regulator transcription factor [Deinococcus deserti]ACO48193.1 putative response regulator, OmpR [Deinococcus deserti VCD115]